MKKHSFRKRLQNIAGSIAFKAMMRASKTLNEKRMERFSKILGNIAYHCSKRYRNIAKKNLAMTLGNEYSPEKIDDMTRQVFQHFCRGGLEFFYFAVADRKDIENMIDIHGKEHLDRALGKGKGVVLITAHFGNWEILARKLCIMGYPVTVIARDSDDPSMTGIANKIREGAGYKVLGRDKSVRGALECLKRNEVLGILPDQNTSAGGVFVDFFGYPAATAVGPAVFALRAGAVLVPVFAYRGSDGRYHGEFQPEIEYQQTGNRDEDELALTGAITKVIENIIRRYPTQWLWLHDRWKKARLVGKLDG
jgi:KDO2-lipid IV(A) lauroyltransferase